MVNMKCLAVASTLLAAAAAQTPNATLRYMPFGDSITEIVCWRGLLYTQLKQAGYNLDFVGSGKQQNPSGCSTANYDKDNEGHSGFLAINIVKQNQLVGWLKQNPADIITMHLGTNDINGGHSNADIIAALTTLVKQMRDSNPKMRIIVSTIIPLPSRNAAVTSLNSAITTWAPTQNSTDSPVWLVDQYTGFPSTDLRDGVHPNAAGDALMAGKWYPAMVAAIKSIQGGSSKREVEFVA